MVSIYPLADTIIVPLFRQIVSAVYVPSPMFSAMACNALLRGITAS